LPQGIEGDLELIETELPTENIGAIAEPGLTSLTPLEKDDRRLMQF
jgi:hypothetical protein